MGAQQAMQSDVVAFNGSPRSRGNTELLLASAIEGAEAAGASVRTFVLNDLNIRPCQNCGYCESKGFCRFAAQDDMGAIYEAIDSRHRFIVASPIYFAGVSAQIKTMIDRCQALWARKYVLKKPHPVQGRKALFLCVGGFPHRRFWPCAEKVVRTWCICADIEYVGGLFYHKVDKKGDIRQHPTALREAFEAGRRLVLGEGPDPEAAGAQP